MASTSATRRLVAKREISYSKRRENVGKRIATLKIIGLVLRKLNCFTLAGVWFKMSQ
jgi:hypothetical protein